MRNWLAAAATAAIVGLSLTSSVNAADMYDDDPPPRRHSAYDDPRYADIYGRGPPRPSPERRYYDEDDRPRVPIPRERVYREPPTPYAEAPPRYRAYTSGRGCAPRDEVRFRLEQDGWGDLHAPEIADDATAFVRARRSSGRLFELQIDRCSGDVIHARPLEPRQRPFAGYAPPRWRY
jgi:hypothetical protein